MDISKKDLLKVTGISYGQLYRWKREGLIPEEWFEKRSSPTGQETFFPSELILNRIAAIQKLKDQYSLEELANLLTPEITNRMFNEEDLELIEEIDIDVAVTLMDAMEKDHFTYVEVITMIVFSMWRRRHNLTNEIIQMLMKHQKDMLDTIGDIGYRMYLLKFNDDYYTMYLAENTTANIKQNAIVFDDRIVVLEQMDLKDISSNVKVKYKDTFQFTSDEEVIK